MPYTAAETYHLFALYVSGETPDFDPDAVPKPFDKILKGFLLDYVEPTGISRMMIFANTLATLTRKEIRTVNAYLELGGIDHASRYIRIGDAQRQILRMLFDIAPATVSEIAQSVSADVGNTHRRLKALIKKRLVRRIHHEARILYYLSSDHFFVEDPFPSSFQNFDLEALLERFENT